MILVCGEITSKAVVDYQKVIRDTIKKIGYDDSNKGMNVCYESTVVSGRLPAGNLLILH